MQNTRKEESLTQMRVQLIQHPELTALTRQKVEELNIAYKDYCTQLESQGSKQAKPVSQAMCVPRKLREVIAMERDVSFKALTDEMIVEHLKCVTNGPIEKVQLDLKKIFKGIKMRPPKNPCDIAKSISDFFEKICEGKNTYGLNERFIGTKEMELCKQSFPGIFEGLWPDPAPQYIEKK